MSLGTAMVTNLGEAICIRASKRSSLGPDVLGALPSVARALKAIR
jgi:hypothetical protein